MINNKKARLIISINDIRRENAKRAEQYVTSKLPLLGWSRIPLLSLLLASEPLKSVCKMPTPNMLKSTMNFSLALREGKRNWFSLIISISFGSKHVSPRTLSSSLLGHMVCVEGIVTKGLIFLSKLTFFSIDCPPENRVQYSLLPRDQKDDGASLCRYE